MVGDFPDSWQMTQIEDCMEAIIDYRGKTPRKTNYGIPLITAKIVKGGRIKSPNEFVDPTDYDVWMRRGLPKKGDVVVTTEAPLGEVAQIDDPKVALAQRLIALRGKSGKLDNTFLKFLMQSVFIQSQLLARASGTTVSGIKQSELRKIYLPLPTIKEQQAIACILGALDDKIELNRRINKTLETTAQAIFKSWFVDFDPVRAKAAGHQLPGLKPEIAKLFPDTFEYSELGEIPRGWRVRPLPEVMHINPTRSLPKGALAPYLDMANMPTHGPFPDIFVMREMGSGMKFKNGDTLVARITPCLENGKTAFVNFLANGEVGWGSTEYIVLRPKGVIPLVFAYLLARTEEFRTFAIQQMTGSSGRQRVPAVSLEKYMIVTPNIESLLYQHFSSLVSQIFDRIKASVMQSRILATIRDTLLPKLISGEVRLPDAERITGRCL